MTDIDTSADASVATAKKATSTTTKRVCNEENCATVLSIYNELSFCSLHQPMIIPRMRGKVL